MVNQKAMSKVLTNLKYKFMQPRLDRPIMLLKSLAATTSAHSVGASMFVEVGHNRVLCIILTVHWRGSCRVCLEVHIVTHYPRSTS